MENRTEELRAPARPAPDEAPLDEPAVLELSLRDWLGVVVRAVKRLPRDNMPMLAQAIAYSTFLAIPSVLLIVVGLFTLLSGPGTIDTVIAHLGHVMPGQATSLIHQSLSRLDHQHQATVVMTIVGFVLALWSTTGAMTSYMTALNIAYERRDSRNFVVKRVVALVMVACIGAAFLLVAGLLIFGPVIERHLGDLLGIPHALGYVWWSVQWPILVAGLLAAFGTLLYLGPDVEHRSWRFLSVGSAVAVAVWLAISGGFAYYTAHFGSYNKTWGSLAAVVIVLVWLWLGALALLLAAEIDAEAERSREPAPRSSGREASGAEPRREA